MTTVRTPESVTALDEHGRTVQEMFSDIAPGYDRANRLMSLGIDRAWRARAVDRLLSVGGSNAAILDLCAGTLDSSLVIHRRYPHATVRAGDFSVGMLEVGRRRLQGAAAQRIHPQQMDAHAIPAADASFDAIFCAFGLRNLSDLERATAEMWRCLKPNGRLVVLEFFRPTTWFSRGFHNVYNHTVLPAVGWACTGNLSAYRYLPRSIGRFVSTGEYTARLERAGFRSVTVEPLTFGIASIVSAERHAEAVEHCA
ncbi:MAG: ubiquinone/menaquinone biosynthesis methyltransferase [Myxococcales bacterium FL481]|nr:MAG: ubiquinone/menaquinone biosynthesis methyltransferase [Myxococcales bacterium FL481]